jgi:uncharacterized membrane protein YdjX (TVP38/TMEM64 family)
MRDPGVTGVPPLLKSLAFFRVCFFVVALALVYWFAQRSGILDQANPQGVRDLVAQWGMLGVSVYLAAFVVGQLVFVPGMVFVVAASLAFGERNGFLLSMSGALLSVSLSFFMARLMGGKPLAAPQSMWLKRLMGQLEAYPVGSMAAMRLLVGTAPWLNYLLGMSSVSYRHYLLASIIGIWPAVLLTVLFTEWLLQYFV